MNASARGSTPPAPPTPTTTTGSPPTFTRRANACLGESGASHDENEAPSATTERTLGGVPCSRFVRAATATGSVTLATRDKMTECVPRPSTHPPCRAPLPPSATGSTLSPRAIAWFLAPHVSGELTTVRLCCRVLASTSSRCSSLFSSSVWAELSPPSHTTVSRRTTMTCPRVSSGWTILSETCSTVTWATSPRPWTTTTLSSTTRRRPRSSATRPS
mmetsp:Transcript_4813/g.11561  ORF Transcript_4813/g.11561 Transcript_4813/m.11561 type:complete len:217 (+) Transcript_4813:882-1532(+)